ncbi:hypothetical protein QBC35DRAFT_453348 [Podospora australis]|uniref:Uncharacterized protein n=1 Tax=Podospora australis TaxID=1536484 RepID=A0AAN6WTX8_9PEZI|nr:hypothetical protein QBC35DRAFT_453348 [Podospora australis]
MSGFHSSNIPLQRGSRTRQSNDQRDKDDNIVRLRSQLTDEFVHGRNRAYNLSVTVDSQTTSDPDRELAEIDGFTAALKVIYTLKKKCTVTDDESFFEVGSWISSDSSLQAPPANDSTFNQASELADIQLSDAQQERGFIRHGFKALMRVEEASKRYYQRFSEIEEQGQFSSILNELRSTFPDHESWLARGKDVREAILKRGDLETLPDVLALFSLSYAMSTLRDRDTVTPRNDVLFDVDHYKNCISDSQERQAFLWLVNSVWRLDARDLDPRLFLNEGLVTELPSQYGPVEPLYHGIELELPDFNTDPVADLKTTILFRGVLDYFSNNKEFFFALSGRGKTILHSKSRWPCSEAARFKATATLRKRFFKPLKRRKSRDNPMFRALLKAAEHFVITGRFRTAVEVEDYLDAIATEFLDTKEHVRFKGWLNGESTLIVDVPNEPPTRPPIQPPVQPLVQPSGQTNLTDGRGSRNRTIRDI